MTARLDLHVQQGADYSVDIDTVDGQGRPRTLVGWTAKAAIRHAPDSPLLYEPDMVVRPGSVRLAIPGVASASWEWRRANYQVLLTGPRGERERLAAGRVIVDPSLLDS